MTTVRFIGDYFSLTVSIVTPVANDWDTVVDAAAELIKGYYGWDVLAVTNDIEVEGHND
jgi:hypothetical protein